MLEIDAREHGDVVVFSLVGRLDSLSSETFRESIVTRVMQGAKTVILDFSGVEFVDSSGFGALVAALNSIGEFDGSIAIAALAGPVKQSFELIRLDRVFPVHATVDEALQAVKG